MQLISTLAVSVPLLAFANGLGYAPQNTTCPDDFDLIREADQLSPDESDWLKLRRPHANEALATFLHRATTNFTNSSFVASLLNDTDSMPIIGVAASGGGYRAMLSGAGMVAALDNRTDGANEHGLGGLLQASTYLAGLSGGNWLTGTLAWNNWTSVQDIINNSSKNNSIWDLSDGFVGTDAQSQLKWSQVFTDVAEKKAAGYNVTLNDYWGRALAYNFFPSLPQGGVNDTWSSLRDVDVFKNGLMPFPITVTDVRHPYTNITSQNSTIIEFNPYEMGSWDPSVYAFANVKYLGTNVMNGKPVDKKQCVVGFDNTGFIIGTSSTLFTPQLISHADEILGNQTSSTVGQILISELGNDNNDVGVYAPNPFLGSTYGNNEQILNSSGLYLADGGEDGIGIPLISLTQKKRNVDVVFALDNSADTKDNYPDGNSMIAAFERQFSEQGKNTSFPYVPDAETFISEGLNKKPVFFGCDARNLTELAYIPPLIIYMPNYNVSYSSNTSTFDLQYSQEERLGLIKNGFEAATRGNFTDDSKFMGCVACAVIKRNQERLNATLPAECQSCFQEYCWSGKSATILYDNSTSVSFDGNSTSTISTANASSTAHTSSSTSANSTRTSSSTTKHKNGGANVVASHGMVAMLMFVLNICLGNF